jgi:ribosomal protein uS13
MARIAGVDLPRNKQARIALTYIYGIGQPRAIKILGTATVDPLKKIQDLSEEEVNRIRQVIENEGQVEGDLRKEISLHIKRLIEIGSYPSQPACPRTAHAHQRPYPQGSAQGHRGRQEEGDEVISLAARSRPFAGLWKALTGNPRTGIGTEYGKSSGRRRFCVG